MTSETFHADAPRSAGPLSGLRVLELGGVGPGPHACMLLADLGADVIRLERLAKPQVIPGTERSDLMLRGRRIVRIDLKESANVEAILRLVGSSDVVVEGFRPGVAERLGLGPTECLEMNPRTVYARMTGWGQDGPWSHLPGHDINFIGLTGVLDNIGRDPHERPVLPLNLLGDFGGGSMFLVMGVLAALWERDRSGLGQVIDGAIVDGTSVLAQMVWSMRASGAWSSGRAVNPLDGHAPFYDTYVCSDGKHVAVGAMEPQFFSALLEGTGLSDAGLPAQWEKDRWSEMRQALTTVFLTQTRDEWMVTFERVQACVTPVLTYDEALTHPHLTARETLVRADGIDQPRPAPRFSRTDPTTPPTPVESSLADELVRWAERSRSGKGETNGFHS